VSGFSRTLIVGAGLQVGHSTEKSFDANPLENIANTTRIAGVVINGRWIAKTEIDKRLAGMRSG
jgi:hypothetical protein